MQRAAGAADSRARSGLTLPARAPPHLHLAQSNMEGQAEVATKNKTSGEYLNGTLAYQVFVNQTTAPLFGQFWDSSTANWTVLDDVKMWYNEIGSQIGVNGSVIPSKPGDAAFGRCGSARALDLRARAD